MTLSSPSPQQRTGRDTSSTPAVHADMSVADMFRSLWGARWFIALGAVVGLGVALVYLLFANPHYRVTMIVAPSERAGRADIRSILPDNASFALQYLVNSIGATDSADLMMFETMLRAPRVSARLMQDGAVVEGMENPGRFGPWRHRPIGSAIDMADHLDRRLHVMPVGSTPMRRIAFDHPSPEFAKALLLGLYAETDKLMKEDFAAKVHQRSQRLKEMLPNVQHPEHRRAMTGMLMEQEHLLMVMSVDEPFAAVIAEPPFMSVRPYWPRRSVVLGGFMLAGMLFGFFVWVCRAGAR